MNNSEPIPLAGRVPADESSIKESATLSRGRSRAIGGAFGSGGRQLAGNVLRLDGASTRDGWRLVGLEASSALHLRFKIFAT